MKTKEEVIKEAWGADYNIMVGIDENGWVSENYLTNDQCILFNYDKSFDYKNVFGYRPKSLQGIENNNGWIKIGSEEDLPKNIIECVTCFYDGYNYVEGNTRDRSPIQLWKAFKNNQITHYKKTIKQPKPLY